MTESCSCPSSRGLDAPHVPSCPQYVGTVTQIYRNPDTGRPIAVPDEIVTQAEREYRAWKAHQRGTPWPVIAENEGYPNGMAASEAVKRYIDEGRAVVGAFRRQEVVATELAVHLALRDAMWDGAMLEHKPSHVMAMLATNDRIGKLYGLDQVDAEDATVQTVVIPSEDYLAQLQAADAEPAADAG